MRRMRVKLDTPKETVKYSGSGFMRFFGPLELI